MPSAVRLGSSGNNDTGCNIWLLRGRGWVIWDRRHFFHAVRISLFWEVHIRDICSPYNTFFQLTEHAWMFFFGINMLVGHLVQNHPPLNIQWFAPITTQDLIKRMPSKAARYALRCRVWKFISIRFSFTFVRFKCQLPLLVHAMLLHIDLFQCGDILRGVPPSGFMNELDAITSLTLFTHHMIFCEPALNGSPSCGTIFLCPPPHHTQRARFYCSSVFLY